MNNLVNDHTALLQQLLTINAGKQISLPSGTFNIRTLTVKPNTKLLINQTTILKGIPTDDALPLLTLSSGVKLSGTGLIDGNRAQRKKGVGISINSSKNVTISGIRIREIAEQGIQVVASKLVSILNVNISGCGAKEANQYQAINLVISNDIQITSCHINNAMHGIQWWGDEINGYCENIKIVSNRIKRVIGGIWGNRGRKVIVSNNVVEICEDVGIDFEHSFNCSALGNTVRDCKNYGLATFFSSERITFAKNRVYQGVNYGHGIGICGSGLSKQIYFIGGSISTKGLNACGLLTVGVNVAQDVLVQGVSIVTEGKNGIPIRIIDNNQFEIINNPLIASKSPTGISLEGSSRSLVQGNTIINKGTDISIPGYRGGIFVYFRSFQHPAKDNTVRGNKISGFRTGINDDCWGDVNSNNAFERNITPNLFHRMSNGKWGGKAIQNFTETKSATPVTYNK